MGSWLTYGLGTLNQNLPGFVVMCPGLPVIGPQLWTSAYLPSIHQGVHLPNNEKEPEKLIQHLRNQKLKPPEQRRQLDLLAELNHIHMEREGGDPQLEGRIQSMEIAYRMQSEAMEAFDLTKEPEAVRERYGEGDFNCGCLIARRLVERGVRMVQVYYGNSQPWDTHDDIMDLRKLARTSDSGMGALLQDLKASGLPGDHRYRRRRVRTHAFGGSKRSCKRTLTTTTMGSPGASRWRHQRRFPLRHRHGTLGPVVAPIRTTHATILHQLGLDHARRLTVTGRASPHCRGAGTVAGKSA
jgi:hypothetical protein